MRPSWFPATGALALTAFFAGFPVGAESLDPWTTPTLDEREAFLLRAEIRSRETLGVGVTRSERLTLQDGTMTHDAHLQTIDTTRKRFRSGGRTYLRFRDCYKYNVAAYRLDRLLGLGLVPVSVERELGGRPGAVTWWVDDVQMAERDRRRAEAAPPDAVEWSRQVSALRLFNDWIANIDANETNILITDDWQLRLIDFTRAFRLDKVELSQLPARIESRLYERLRSLTGVQLADAVGSLLTGPEIAALLARRDRIVEHYQRKASLWGADVVFVGRPEAGLSGDSRA